MGYGTHIKIGVLDVEVLKKNISTITNKVNAGTTTIEKEIGYRNHEIDVLEKMTPKSIVTRRNNKRRINYIKAEIYVLERIVL